MGDDPLTLDQHYRSVLLSIISSSSLSGNIGFSFLGESVDLDLSSPSSIKCKDALSQISHFQEVDCSVRTDSVSFVYFNITILEFPLFPVINNLLTHDGNPPISAFQCHLPGTSSGASCNVSNIVHTNTIGTTFNSLEERN
jgi:hypothetical protein